MKARIKGSNDSFREITGIEIDYVVYDPEVIEFENDFIPNNITAEDEHWQDVRERAAIAAMQGLAANSCLVYDSGEEKIFITDRAMRYADELIKKLKRKQ